MRITGKTLCLAIWLVTQLVPARGGNVTLADLERAVINTRIVSDQLVRKDGRERLLQLQDDWKIILGPENKISWTITQTARGPGGGIRTTSRSFSWTVERAGEKVDLGGGHGVWIFADGVLTALRTFKGGALKQTILFDRSDGALTCTANAAFAYEKGVNGIVLNSPFDNAPIVILRAKQLSSSCRITMPDQGGAQ
jgi:hypothetical protein